MKSNCVFVLDMGGTNIKGAVINNEHEIVNEIIQVPADSNGEYETIKGQFAKIFNLLKKIAIDNNLEQNGMIVSSPGPVDFKNGIPLMTHKYTAIYGKNLKELFKEMGINGNIIFQSDVISFFKAADLENKNNENAVAITLGTGLGFCYKENGIIPTNDLGSCVTFLFKEPYKDGIYEDYFSGRGVVKHYFLVSKKVIRGASDVFKLAENGDQEAIESFDLFGDNLGSALKPILKKHNAKILYIGGQVSKSSKYFINALKKQLNDVEIKIYADPDFTLTRMSYELI